MFSLYTTLIALGLLIIAVLIAGWRYLREDNMINALPDLDDDDEIPDDQEELDDEELDDDEDDDNDDDDEDDDDDGPYYGDEDDEFVARRRYLEDVPVPDTILGAVVKEPSDFPEDTVTRLSRADWLAIVQFRRELLRDARPEFYAPVSEYREYWRAEVSAVKLRHDMERAAFRKEMRLPIAA